MHVLVDVLNNRAHAQLFSFVLWEHLPGVEKTALKYLWKPDALRGSRRLELSWDQLSGGGRTL